MNRVFRILYKSLYRICQRHDRHIPRNRQIFWNQQDTTMVNTLRRSARKLSHLSPEATMEYGFATLRQLRSYFEASLRWHQVLHNHSKGQPIPIESGAIAIAQVANPTLDAHLVINKIDGLHDIIKSRLEERGIQKFVLCGGVRVKEEEKDDGEKRKKEHPSEMIELENLSKKEENEMKRTDMVVRGNEEEEEEGKVRLLKETLQVVNEVLFDEMGFCSGPGITEVIASSSNLLDVGWTDEDAFIDEVLERKSGIPVSLSVLYMCLVQRLGIHLDGFRFPGRFIVGYLSEHDERSLFIDVYNKGSFHTPVEFRDWLIKKGICPSTYSKYTTPCSLPQIYYTMVVNILEKYDREKEEEEEERWSSQKNNQKQLQIWRKEKDALEPYL